MHQLIRSLTTRWARWRYRRRHPGPHLPPYQPVPYLLNYQIAPAHLHPLSIGIITHLYGL